MGIFIRVDASAEIGIGHVSRCLALANKYQELDNEVTFICRELVGDCRDLIKNHKFKILSLPLIEENLWAYLTENWELDALLTIEMVASQKVDLLIVDHYSLDEKWEKKISPFVENILVIDDMADRPHYCDYLVDHNDYLNLNERYNKLIPDFCVPLLGPTYAMLRQEFIVEKGRIKEKKGPVKNILVSFGGSDPTNETLKVIKALIGFKGLTVHVVVGSSNQYATIIKEYCEKNDNYCYYYQINNMASLINQCDIGIGAGGVSTWERCSLGLPSIVVATAENQLELSENANQKGIIKYLGLAESQTTKSWEEETEKFIKNEIQRIEIHKKALEVIDCLGVERIVEKTLV